MSSMITTEYSMAGFSASTAQWARRDRDELASEASAVASIGNQIDADSALATLKHITAFTSQVEVQREAAKRPLLVAGNLIQALSKELTETLKAEGERISKILGAFEKLKRDKIEDERRAAEAEAARLQYEAQKAASAAIRKAPDELAGIRAADTIIEEAQVKAVQVIQRAATVAAPKTEGALRGAPQFEVIDIKAFHAANPELCIVEANKSAINSIIRQNPNIQFPGLRVWWDHKISVK